MLLAKLKVLGHSMEPQIKDGSTVLISKLFYLFKKPKINDIVAFKLEDKILVKRIVRIIDNSYFVEGDNKEDSFDGRQFGYISVRQIIGKVFYRL